jgi:hypothetical protein
VGCATSHGAALFAYSANVEEDEFSEVRRTLGLEDASELHPPGPFFLPWRKYSAAAGKLLRGELASEGGSMDHDVVRARRFELVDDEGRPRAVLTIGEGTHLVVLG